MRKKGLGRGLADIGLGELLGPMKLESSSTKQDKLSVEEIVPSRFQPRKVFPLEGLEELAQSIKKQGIIQPIVVRPLENSYELIAGERRWRAAKLAGLSEVPVVIRDVNDESAMAIALIENIQRQDLNVIEEALALNRLSVEFKMTHQTIAEAVGKSRAAVTNLLRLLKLNQDVRDGLEQGKLEMGHARALLALEGVEQSRLAQMIVQQSWSVRETERWIRERLQKKGPTLKPATKKIDPDVRVLQSRLSEILGADVSIYHESSGSGKVVIRYHSLDELTGILDHVRAGEDERSF